MHRDARACPASSTVFSKKRHASRRGGSILITVPFAARWHFIPHDYWRFTPSSLRHLLEKHHFTDVAVYARGNSVTVACYKVMALYSAVLDATGLCRFRRSRIAVRLLGLLLSPLLIASSRSSRTSRCSAKAATTASATRRSRSARRTDSIRRRARLSSRRARRRSSKAHRRSTVSPLCFIVSRRSRP